MTEEQAGNYEFVKKAILKSYKLTAEHYRFKFRTSEKLYGEDFSQWAKITRRYLDRWMSEAEADDEESTLKQITMERLMDGVSPELRSWLREHNPKMAEELADLANTHVQARKGRLIGGMQPFQI